MPLFTSTGSFTVPAATGNKQVSGLGFQPKVVLFWGNRRSADGATGAAPNHECAMYFGIALSSSSRVVVGQDDDGSADTGSFDNTSLCIRQADNGTVNFSADFVSMDSGGFTVNFAVANATAYIVNYTALGGSDLTNAFIKSITTPTTTGNQATTGVGFKPDCVITLAHDSSYPAGAIANSFGFGVDSTHRGGISSVYDGTSNTVQAISNAKVFINYQNSAGGSQVRRDADLVTLDSDGFTFNWTTVQASTQTVYVLCLKGGKYFVGNFNQNTANGSQGYTGVGYQPTGLMFLNNMIAFATIDSTRLCSAIGMASGTGVNSSVTGQAHVWYESGTDGVAGLDRAAIYTSYADNTTPTLNAKAAITSFDSDGFTLNYTTSDATARGVVYLAVGNTTAGGLFMGAKEKPILQAVQNSGSF